MFNSMRKKARNQKSQVVNKVLYLSWAILYASLVAGCATTGVKPRQQAATSFQPAESKSQPEPKIIKVEPTRPKIELTDDLLYRILEAEFAGQHGQLEIAVSSYLNLARTTRDPKIVERATWVSVFARNNEAASEAANIWIALDPRNPGPHQVLALMAIRERDIDNALLHLQSMLDYTYGEVDQKLLMIVNLVRREAENDLIMEVMEKLIVTHKDSPQVLFAFARIASVLGNYDRAIELLDKTLELDFENDNAVISYIAIKKRQGKIDEAIIWIENLLRNRGDNDFNLRLRYARLLTDSKRYDDSRRQYEILVVQAPDNVDILFALGLLYLQTNRLNDAEVYFSRLSRSGSFTNESNYYLGRITEDRDELDQAVIWYQGVQTGQNYFDSRVRLALILAKRGRIEDARNHLNSIFTQNGVEQVMLIQAESAILIEENRLQEAMRVYNSAIGDDYNQDLLYARAMLAEKMDRLDILESDLKQILSHDPDNAQALNALGYTLADRTSRYDEALELINRALTLSPNDYYILDSKGWILFRLGKLDEAIEYLQKALKLQPDAEIAAHLGEVLWVKGNTQEAIRVWETALKIAPDNPKLQNVIQRYNP